jgi:transposase InsO family protein
VKPETLVGWHRAIVRRHWRLLSGRKPGRPPEITPEMEQLVLRIARENSWMGHGKIAGEMRKLGFVRFGRSSVARILKKHGLTPERRHRFGLGWLQFLGHYGRSIWASDFCTVTTATLQTYYVVFFLEIGTRRIIHWNASNSTTTSAGPTNPCSICRRRPWTRIGVKARSSPARCSEASSTTTAVSPRDGVLNPLHPLVP